MEEEAKKDETEHKQEETQRKQLDKMTATELREYALEKNIEGLTGVHAMKKEELLKAIKDALGIKEEEPARKAKRPAVKKEVNVKEVKQKIGRLKEEKKQAISSADKKKAKVLRRRINRLKKQTKRVAKA